jgi:hypothetical protein
MTILLCLGPFLAAAAQESPFRESVIGQVGDQETFHVGLVTRTLDRVAYVGIRHGKHHVVLDGRAGEAFDETAQWTWSPDEEVLAYAARRGKQWRWVVKDRVTPEFETVGSFAFSADSKSYFCLGKTGTRWTCLLNGVKVEEANSFPWAGFNPGTNELLYIVPGPKGPVLSEAGRKRDVQIVGGIAFSPDGKRTAHRTWKTAGKKTTTHLSVDGKLGPAFDSVDNAVFSEDGSQVAYVARSGGRESVVLADKVVETCDRVYRLGFAPDGRLYYTADTSGSRFLVVGSDRWGPWAQHLDPPIFAPDGKTYAFRVLEPGRMFYMINGKSGPVFEGTTSLTFHPKTLMPAYLAKKDDAWLLVLGETGVKVPYPPFSVARFSPDGKHVSFVGLRDRSQFLRLTADVR